MAQSKLSRFTQRRNWLIARMRGATQMFSRWSMRDFSPEIKEEAAVVCKSLEELRIKLSSTWSQQKAYFLEKHPVKKD